MRTIQCGGFEALPDSTGALRRISLNLSKRILAMGLWVNLVQECDRQLSILGEVTESTHKRIAFLRKSKRKMEEGIEEMKEELRIHGFLK